MRKNIHLLFFLLALCLSSCIPNREFINFNEGPEFPSGVMDIPEIPPLRIQPDDILDISVRSLDMQVAAPFNLSITLFGDRVNPGGQSNVGPTDYLVDNEGYIEFPVLGPIKVEGLTKKELQDLLKRQLAPYLEDPVIIIRFSNLRFTVFGSVSSPGTFTIPNERVTLIEAITYAGNVSLFADRENIQIIREQNGERIFGEVNLRDRGVFYSPFFYLRQNDVIYVRPRPEETLQSRNQLNRILPWITIISSITTLAITLSRL